MTQGIRFLLGLILLAMFLCVLMYCITPSKP